MQTIDLNKAKGRKVIEVVVANKTFRITRVVTGVRQLYADYMIRTVEALKKTEELPRKEGESDADYQSRVERISREVEEFSEEKKERFFGMVELILTRNGYELERGWWNNYTDEIDQQKFLEICLNKDAPAQKKTMTGKGSTTKN